MKHRRIAFALCVSALGCAHNRKVTRQEWISMSSRTFKNTTVDAVLTSAEKVLTLDDPSDVEVFHTKNRMVGTRRYFIYAVLAASAGHYAFDVTATQQGADVLAELLISDSNQPITPSATAGPGPMQFTASAGLVTGTPVQFREAYDLFFDRMAALAGTAAWRSCVEARDGTANDFTDALCLLADDKIPANVRLSPKTAEHVAKLKARKEAEDRIRLPCNSSDDCVNGGICIEAFCRI
jgi:hypothetical protein